MSDPLASRHRLAPTTAPAVVVLIGFERPDAEALRTRLVRLSQQWPRGPQVSPLHQAGSLHQSVGGVEVVVSPDLPAHHAGRNDQDPAAIETVLQALRAAVGGRAVAVVCLGERAGGETAKRLIAGHELDGALASGVAATAVHGGRQAAVPADAAPRVPPLHIVAAAGPDPEIFQELIAEDRIFYLSQRPPATEELAALIGSAVLLYETRRDAAAAAALGPPAGAAPHPYPAGGGGSRFDVAEVLRALALQPALGDRAEVLAEAVREAADAQRGYCLLHDPQDDTLWSRERGSGAERRDSAAVGIASFVLRSGLSLIVPRAGRDSRYDREADDPEGDGSERLVAVPVRDDDGRVVAVLVAVRTAREAEFGAAQVERLERLAAAAAPFLPPPRPEEVLGDDALFRREALERYQMLDEAQDPLRISPAWTRWTYWTLLAALAGAVLFSVLGEVKEYASGMAVVWMGTRDDVTAETGGTVSAVEVAPGQRVRPGQVLVRLHEAQEAAELARLDQEFDLQLVNRLRDPADPGPEQALIVLRTQRQLASERLGERTLRATSAGIASDVRVRPGEFLTAGQPVLSIVRGQDRPSVVVLMPGQFRPLVRRGMPIRFEISGYRYAYQRLTVDAVGDEVVGPAEARRYLGPEIGDAVELTGPVVILKA
ncbi:MAG TPA: HlyD family efflux transporter periplasmic adaptor subunit, partial [Thermoanaerobaculia bacterium]|nr:HlyD family efflux transporter periplasmic adaptor subunit [Thermoanaerobaculia bacterium]